jgi:branched-chain amino acid transport system substrate-binding protein
VKGLTEGVAGKIPIVLEMPYHDVQMVNLQASGASSFFDVATPQFAIQAIKKAVELRSRPLHILNNVSASIGSVLRPSGLTNSKGIVSRAYLKDPSEPQWQSDSGLRHWSSFMDKYFSNGDKTVGFTVYGYSVAQTVVQVLLPRITVNTSPTEYAPVKQLQMMQFMGKHWELFGPVLTNQAAAN